LLLVAVAVQVVMAAVAVLVDTLLHLVFRWHLESQLPLRWAAVVRERLL
jgi:hypothetical protein